MDEDAASEVARESVSAAERSPAGASANAASGEQAAAPGDGDGDGVDVDVDGVEADGAAYDQADCTQPDQQPSSKEIRDVPGASSAGTAQAADSAEDPKGANPGTDPVTTDPAEEGDNPEPEPAISVAYAAYDYALCKLVFYRAAPDDEELAGDQNDASFAAKQVFYGFEDESYEDEFAVPWYQCSESVLDVVFAGNVAPNSTAYWFANFRNLKSFDALGCLDTSGVTSMRGMFAGCDALQSVSLSGWDLGMLEDADAMFADCASLAQLPGFDDAFKTAQLPAEQIPGMNAVLALRNALPASAITNPGDQPSKDPINMQVDAGPSAEADVTGQSDDVNAGFDIYVGEPSVPEFNDVVGPKDGPAYTETVSRTTARVRAAARPSRAARAAAAVPGNAWGAAGQLPIAEVPEAPASAPTAVRPETVPDSASPLVDAIQLPPLQDFPIGAVAGAATAVAATAGALAANPAANRLAMLIAALGLASAAAFALVFCMKVR